jgi:hypothetical protein
MFTPLSHLPSARSSVASTSKYREDRAATASMLMSVSVSLKSSDEASSASASPAAWDARKNELKCQSESGVGSVFHSPLSVVFCTGAGDVTG